MPLLYLLSSFKKSCLKSILICNKIFIKHKFQRELRKKNRSKSFIQFGKRTDYPNYEILTCGCAGCVDWVEAEAGTSTTTSFYRLSTHDLWQISRTDYLFCYLDRILIVRVTVWESQSQGGNGAFRTPGIFGIFTLLPGFSWDSWDFQDFHEIPRISMGFSGFSEFLSYSKSISLLCTIP
jgi:hypothetical protein